MLPGVDVSSFQGAPAAWRGQAGTIDWAAVKITELEPPVPGRDPHYFDPDAAADWAFLKQQGKGRIAYLFGHPSVPAAESVAYFLSKLRPLGIEDGDGVALDLEVTDGLGPAAVDKWGLDVLRELDTQLDRPPLFYSYPSFITAGNCASLGGYPLWLSNPSAAAGHPQVPAPWKSCVIQQTGITGAIDRDQAFFPDLGAMRAAIGKHLPPPPPGVVHWRPTWPLTLQEAANRHHTTPEEMIALAKAAGHQYRPAMVAYIEKGDWNARLPLDVELFAPA